MGYQPRSKSPRTSGRGSIKSPLERGKGRGRKHKSADNSTVEQKQVATLKEVSDKTLKRLHILGKQRFGSSPFREHFDRWLVNLTDVLSEFELNPNVNVDEQFVTERSQILSTIEFELKQRGREEESLEEAIQSLSNSKNLLGLIRKEYTTKAGQIAGRKRSEIRRIYRNIDDLRKELDDIVRMKAGFFRGISKKAREQKEAEAIQKLNAKQNELELAMLDLTEVKEKLREEYERNKKPVIEQVRDSQKKVERLETDASLEDRWFACEALIDSVNTLLQRKTLQPH
jgi:hypothetical protein